MREWHILEFDIALGSAIDQWIKHKESVLREYCTKKVLSEVWEYRSTLKLASIGMIYICSHFGRLVPKIWINRSQKSCNHEGPQCQKCFKVVDITVVLWTASPIMINYGIIKFFAFAWQRVEICWNIYGVKKLCTLLEKRRRGNGWGVADDGFHESRILGSHLVRTYTTSPNHQNK